MGSSPESRGNLSGLSGEKAVTLAELVSALSFALDLTEGAVPGHAVRSCLLGMRLAHALELPPKQLQSLYYALMLKDIGCSSNAARMCQIIGGGDDRKVKAGVKLQDWTKPHKPRPSTLRLLWREASPGGSATRKAATILKIALQQHANNEEMIRLRCDRGAAIVRKLGMDEATAGAVRALDEHWDGSGYPERSSHEKIPLLARIMGIAQHLDAFCMEGGPALAIRTLRERSGRWFDPEMVKATLALHQDGLLWRYCFPDDDGSVARDAVIDLEPLSSAALTTGHIDEICRAFADVVDAKSPFTFRHSLGVSAAAVCIAEKMGLPPYQVQTLHRAALLHDIGKLSVPNSILDKQGSLTAGEWAVVRQHPRTGQEILNRIGAFAEIAEIASHHHERLNGKGYPYGLPAGRLPLLSRILAVADVYGALAEDRPYREGLSDGKILEIMQGDALDRDCFDALRSLLGEKMRSSDARASETSSLSMEPQACTA